MNYKIANMTRLVDIVFSERFLLFYRFLPWYPLTIFFTGKFKRFISNLQLKYLFLERDLIRN